MLQLDCSIVGHRQLFIHSEQGPRPRVRGTSEKPTSTSSTAKTKASAKARTTQRPARFFNGGLALLEFLPLGAVFFRVAMDQL